MKYDSIMLDLETMGNGPYAVIVAIGAFKFNLREIQSPDSIQDHQKFLFPISINSCLNFGLKIDASTIEWWMTQPNEVKKGIQNGQPLNIILERFSEFYEKGQYIWGNYSTFDNVILRNAFNSVNKLDPGKKCPWHYKADMCYRTIKNLFGKDIPFERFGVHHNPLDDAITQALHLQKIMQRLKSGY